MSRQAIDKANSEFVAAMNRGDVAAAVRVYTEDAKLLPPNSPAVHGRTSIQGFWEGAAQALGIKQVTMHTVSVEFIDNTAIEQGEYTLELLVFLRCWLDSDPRALGYAFSVWTINKLRKHLEKQTGILLSYTQFRALLNKHEYVYRQPKHDLSDLQDADAKAATEDFLNWLKKSPSPTLPLSSSLWTKRV